MRNTGLRKRTLLTAATAFFALLAVALLHSGCAQETFTLEKGVLSVACLPDNPPLSSLSDGECTGFDAELAAEIAARLGLKCTYSPTGWNDLFTGLEEGRYDLVVSAVTITHERSRRLDFSIPYLNTDQSIVVLRDSPTRGIDDLPGRIVAVLGESTPQHAAENIPGLLEIKRYDNVSAVYRALGDGEADAVIIDYAIARYRSQAEGDTEVVATIRTVEQYGVVTKKGNRRLLEKVNSALEEIMADGTYDAIGGKWFGDAWGTHRLPSTR